MPVSKAQFLTRLRSPAFQAALQHPQNLVKFKELFTKGAGALEAFIDANKLLFLGAGDADRGADLNNAALSDVLKEAGPALIRFALTTKADAEDLDHLLKAQNQAQFRDRLSGVRAPAGLHGVAVPGTSEDFREIIQPLLDRGVDPLQWGAAKAQIVVDAEVARLKAVAQLKQAFDKLTAPPPSTEKLAALIRLSQCTTEVDLKACAAVVHQAVPGIVQATFDGLFDNVDAHDIVKNIFTTVYKPKAVHAVRTARQAIKGSLTLDHADAESQLEIMNVATGADLSDAQKAAKIGLSPEQYAQYQVLRAGGALGDLDDKAKEICRDVVLQELQGRDLTTAVTSVVQLQRIYTELSNSRLTGLDFISPVVAETANLGADQDAAKTTLLDKVHTEALGRIATGLDEAYFNARTDAELVAIIGHIASDADALTGHHADLPNLGDAPELCGVLQANTAFNVLRNVPHTAVYDRARKVAKDKLLAQIGNPQDNNPARLALAKLASLAPATMAELKNSRAHFAAIGANSTAELINCLVDGENATAQAVIAAAKAQLLSQLKEAIVAQAEDIPASVYNYFLATRPPEPAVPSDADLNEIGLGDHDEIRDFIKAHRDDADVVAKMQEALIANVCADDDVKDALADLSEEQLKSFFAKTKWTDRADMLATTDNDSLSEDKHDLLCLLPAGHPAPQIEQQAAIALYNKIADGAHLVKGEEAFDAYVALASIDLGDGQAAADKAAKEAFKALPYRTVSPLFANEAAWKAFQDSLGTPPNYADKHADAPTDAGIKTFLGHCAKHAVQIAVEDASKEGSEWLYDILISGEPKNEFDEEHDGIPDALKARLGDPDKPIIRGYAHAHVKSLVTNALEQALATSPVDLSRADAIEQIVAVLAENTGDIPDMEAVDLQKIHPDITPHLLAALATNPQDCDQGDNPARKAFRAMLAQHAVTLKVQEILEKPEPTANELAAIQALIDQDHTGALGNTITQGPPNGIGLDGSIRDALNDNGGGQANAQRLVARQAALKTLLIHKMQSFDGDPSKEQQQKRIDMLQALQQCKTPAEVRLWIQAHRAGGDILDGIGDTLANPVVVDEAFIESLQAASFKVQETLELERATGIKNKQIATVCEEYQTDKRFTARLVNRKGMVAELSQPGTSAARIKWLFDDQMRKGKADTIKVSIGDGQEVDAHIYLRAENIAKHFYGNPALALKIAASLKDMDAQELHQLDTTLRKALYSTDFPEPLGVAKTLRDLRGPLDLAPDVSPQDCEDQARLLWLKAVARTVYGDEKYHTHLQSQLEEAERRDAAIADDRNVEKFKKYVSEALTQGPEKIKKLRGLHTLFNQNPAPEAPAEDSVDTYMQSMTGAIRFLANRERSDLHRAKFNIFRRGGENISKFFRGDGWWSVAGYEQGPRRTATLATDSAKEAFDKAFKEQIQQPLDGLIAATEKVGKLSTAGHDGGEGGLFEESTLTGSLEYMHDCLKKAEDDPDFLNEEKAKEIFLVAAAQDPKAAEGRLKQVEEMLKTVTDLLKVNYKLIHDLGTLSRECESQFQTQYDGDWSKAPSEFQERYVQINKALDKAWKQNKVLIAKQDFLEFGYDYMKEAAAKVKQAQSQEEDLYVLFVEDPSCVEVVDNFDAAMKKGQDHSTRDRALTDKQSAALILENVRGERIPVANAFGLKPGQSAIAHDYIDVPYKKPSSSAIPDASVGVIAHDVDGVHNVVIDRPIVFTRGATETSPDTIRVIFPKEAAVIASQEVRFPGQDGQPDTVIKKGEVLPYKTKAPTPTANEKMLMAFKAVFQHLMKEGAPRPGHFLNIRGKDPEMQRFAYFALKHFVENNPRLKKDYDPNCVQIEGMSLDEAGKKKGWGSWFKRGVGKSSGRTDERNLVNQLADGPKDDGLKDIRAKVQSMKNKLKHASRAAGGTAGRKPQTQQERLAQKRAEIEKQFADKGKAKLDSGSADEEEAPRVPQSRRPG